MGRLILFGLLALVIGLPAALVVMSVEKEPLILKSDEMNLTDFKHVQELAKRYDPRRMPADKITTVKATSDELDTLLKGAVAGSKRIAARAMVTRYGVVAALTAELPVPENPLGRYVNIRTVVAPSRDGLEINRFAVGSVEFPPSLIEPAILLGLNRLAGDENGQPILDSIRSVEVNEPQVTIAFQPPDGLVDTIKAATRRYVQVSDPTLVGRYYQKIDDVMSDLPRGGRVSLIEVIRPVFQLALSRSQKLNPVPENEAALLAMAIYFGDRRFERFIGEVMTDEEKSRRQSLDHIRLSGRHDFVQHFTISLGLALTGGDVAANIIGEFKEAKDSEKSSGFSFTDIGADRAGVNLAKRAIANPDAAFRTQRILANTYDENVFFPEFTDLPEGLSHADFRARYGDVNSRQYKRVIAEIDKRIFRTRLYR